MVPKKHSSKRVTAHKRYKIQRKIRDHHRKERKDARLHPKKLKKDPGIPNLWPFKDKLLKQVEEHKQQTEDDKLKRKQLQQSKRANDLSALKRSAEQRTVQYDKSASAADTMDASTGRLKGDNSRKAYYKEFKKVLEAADVILEVLDARDPLGCRSKQIEELILSSGSSKKIILVLNKVDLVPREVVERWLKYLRNEFPTVAFKASTQTQRKNIGHANVSIASASDNALNSSECLGADTLVKLLKNYCRNLDIKTSISVGVIGFPNVGKSSLINSLKRSKACGVGAMPGFTKAMQEIHLDKHIKLLDCPGIIFATGTSEADVLLRNCIKVDQIEDAIGAVGHLLDKINPEQLMTLYAVPEFNTVHEFLVSLARLRGKLKKGGIPDLEQAGRMVLQDWNGGKIPYFTEPPKETRLLSAKVLDDYSKAFSLEDLALYEASDLATLKSQTDMGGNFVAMQSSGQMDIDFDGMDDDDEDEEDDAEMDADGDKEGDDDGDEDDDEGEVYDDIDDDDEDDDGQDEDDEDDIDVSVAPSKSKNKGKGRNALPSLDELDHTPVRPARSQQSILQTAMEAAINPQINQQRKKQTKQHQKAMRRATVQRLANDDDEDDGDDSYSFDRDFSAPN